MIWRRNVFAVVSIVGGDGEWRSSRVEHIYNDLAVMDLSAGHGRRSMPRSSQIPALARGGSGGHIRQRRTILCGPSRFKTRLEPGGA